MHEPKGLLRLFWGQSSLKKVTVLLLFALCLTGVIGIPFYVAASTSTPQTYVDQKLGFSLQLPTGWEAIPQPGRANNQNASVAFFNPQLPKTLLQIGVMRQATAATDFAKRGKPTLSLGGNSAFQADTHAAKQMPVPCLNRIMLAHDDTVIASWCAPDATAHRHDFESILATYRDAAGTAQNTITTSPLATTQRTNVSLDADTMQTLQTLDPTPTMTKAPVPVNTVQTCSQIMQNPGPQMWGTLPTNDPNFGQQVVNSTDLAWTNEFGQGVAVCNDDNWENSYLFQCVELANRFINEEWGLPSFTVDAFAYYDNYQNGTSYPGQARTLFGDEAQLIDDASQGNNASFPVPGDLLIFQDVNDGAHWTSGELYNTPDYPNAYDPGHVVIVTSVTATSVNVVQENWQNGETWSFPLQHLSNGYHVVDNSGWTGRITRGWIHFSANSKRANYTSMAPNSDGHLEAFARGTDNNIWHNYQTSPGGTWTGWTPLLTGNTFNGDPTVGVNADGMLEVFARGSDNRIRTTWQNTTGSSTSWAAWVTLDSASSPLFKGTPTVAVNADGRLEVFALATDNTIWHDYQTSANSSWSGWSQLSTQTFNGDPTVSVNSDGHMEVFAVGSDNNLYHTWETTDSSSTDWYNWTLLQSGSSYTFQGTPSIALNADGRMEIMARAGDGTIWHNYQTSASGVWNGWSQLSTQTFHGDPSIVSNADGHLEMFAVGSDNYLYHTWETVNGSSTSWYNWTLLQAGSSDQFQGAAAVSPDVAGRLVVMALGPNSNMWTNFQNTLNGTWYGWVLLTPNSTFQQ